MDIIDLTVALENPEKASISRLDEILLAQLTAVRAINKYLPARNKPHTSPKIKSKKKKKSGGRRSLRSVGARI